MRIHIDSGYIIYVGAGETEISEEQYGEILAALNTMPEVAAGYGARLRTDLTWELYELPYVPAEATSEDYEAALNRLGVET